MGRSDFWWGRNDRKLTAEYPSHEIYNLTMVVYGTAGAVEVAVYSAIPQYCS